jgi:serine/threonine protein kinase
MSTPSDDTPIRIGNRYRLEERIGAGAMGAVWRATDELLNRTVAVKELLAAAVPARGGALEESRQRILREGRIGARLQHPHVISMFDVVVHEDSPWLVMEYLPSQSLAQRLAQDGALPPREAADIGRQVADGLAAAHKAGVVHRDIKPGNVLLGDDGRVKLTTSASPAVDDVQLTRTGLIAGTPAFLSPEVARGHERPPRPTSSRWAPRCTPRSRGPHRSDWTTRVRAAAQGGHREVERRSRPASCTSDECGCWPRSRGAAHRRPGRDLLAEVASGAAAPPPRPPP